MERLMKDVRVGLRGFLARPALTAAMVLTLGIAIGATTAIVSAVEGVLLDPLPYSKPSDLVVVEVNTGGSGWYGLSAPEYLDARDQLGQLTRRFVRVRAGDARRLGRAAPRSGGLRERRRPTAPGRVPAFRPDVLDRRGRARRQPRRSCSGIACGRSCSTIPAPWVARCGSRGRCTPWGVMPERFAFPSDVEEAWVPLGIDPDDPPRVRITT